ncbi:MAG: sulfite exporter TauE/SafE family protein, partial [Panacagrimonas sp.]
MAALSLTTLGVPAMLAAGVASSPHCALMCGALYARTDRAIDFDRLFGRLAAYATIGALAGAAGEWLLRAAEWAGSGQTIRMALLPLMVWLLVRANRSSRARHCCDRPTPQASATGHARRLAAGFATGLVPCPLLYA